MIFNKKFIKQKLFDAWSPKIKKSDKKFYFCFHRVLPRERYDALPNKAKEFSVTVEYFEDFIISMKEHLAFKDYHLEDTGLTAHITFDDGYKDNFTYALPILEQHSCPATFFISEGYISRSVRDFSKMCADNFSDFLDWEEIKEIANNKLFNIGSHCISHLPLSHISKDLLEREIKDSKLSIEEQLNQEVFLIAYPYGGFNEINRRVISYAKQSGYKFGFSANFISKLYLPNNFVIPRYFITNNSDFISNLKRMNGLSSFTLNQMIP